MRERIDFELKLRVCIDRSSLCIDCKIFHYIL